MIQTLLGDNHLSGKYVAMKSFSDHTVVGEGETPKEAHDKASKKGYENLVVTFVPIKDVVQIY